MDSLKNIISEINDFLEAEEEPGPDKLEDWKNRLAIINGGTEA